MAEIALHIPPGCHSHTVWISESPWLLCATLCGHPVIYQPIPSQSHLQIPLLEKYCRQQTVLKGVLAPLSDQRENVGQTLIHQKTKPLSNQQLSNVHTAVKIEAWLFNAVWWEVRRASGGQIHFMEASSYCSARTNHHQDLFGTSVLRPSGSWNGSGLSDPWPSLRQAKSVIAIIVTSSCQSILLKLRCYKVNTKKNKI